ncbi:MAG: ribosome maturation factor RimM, partial [Bacteroidales bacterium]|nr:ribosome maturation factor RimM [Bacteroidales bacterium]
SGLKGDVLAMLDVDKRSDYAQLDSVLVMVKKSLVPYFLERVEIRPNGAVLHFEDTGLEEAEKMIGCELYLPLDVLPPLTGNRFYFHEVIGFEVVDAEKGVLGVLREIMDNGPQPVLCIDHASGKEILMPLIDPFLEKVERSERRLYVRAPEGLVDFYLEQ